MRPLLIALAGAAMLGGCSSITALRDSGPLFPANGEESLDFENQTIGRPPAGFVGGAEQWLVAESPSAASGEQVLVHDGGETSRITLEAGEGGKEIRAEVAVRVFVGAPGAGVACGEGENGYLVRFEPEARRAALYDRSGVELGLVAERPVEVRKGKWIRLGIRCGDGRVTGYVDGEPIASHRTDVALSSLELHADAEVTAPFDDVRFRVN